MTERKHKEPKRFARLALHQGTNYNKTFMEEVILQHFSNWTMSNKYKPGLLNAREPTKRLREDLCRVWPSASSFEMSSIYVSANGGKFQSGDAVLLLGDEHAHAAGMLLYHVSVDGLWTCLQVWPRVAAQRTRCNKHRMCRSPRMVRSIHLHAVVCYRKLSEEFASVHVPMHAAG